MQDSASVEKLHDMPVLSFAEWFLSSPEFSLQRAQVIAQSDEVRSNPHPFTLAKLRTSYPEFVRSSRDANESDEGPDSCT